MPFSKNQILLSRLMATVAMTASPFATAALQAREDTTLDAATKASATESQDGDIVVTADKRDITLQNAPLTMSAISASEMSSAGIRSSVDLNAFVPGLTVSRNEGNGRVATIRGIGLEANQNDGAQPGVAYHIDGVYIASPLALNTDFVDVARVDVLRGPQGTVFGQNATGGMINVVTNQPSLDQVEGYATLGVGNYNLFRGEGAFNLPLAPTLALRVAVQGNKHDGFAKATQVPGYSDGYGLDDENSLYGRVQLLWKPAENFSLLFAGTYGNIDQHDRAQKSIFDPDPDPRRLTQDYPGLFSVTSHIYSLTAQLDLPGVTIKNIASYQRVENAHSFDRDRLTFALSTPHDLMPFTDRIHRAYTEELNIASTGSRKLDWIGGLFFIDIKQYVCALQVLVLPGSALPVSCAPRDMSFPLANIAFQASAKQARRSYSGYGQLTYHFSDAARLTAGARYTHEEITATNLTNYGAFGGPVNVGADADALTGKVSLDVDVAPRHLVYATYSRGFKPGGSNLSTRPQLVSILYKPEHVDSVEIGSKNRFADGAITLNVAGFYYWYQGLQFQADDPVPFQGGVSNIDKSEIYGVEFEGSAKLPGGFRLDGTLALERGKITGNQVALDGTLANLAQLAAIANGYTAFSPETTIARAAVTQSVTGNRLPKLPGVTGSAILTHTADFAGGTLTSKAFAIYRGSYKARVFNRPGIDSVPSYWLFNLGFQYAPQTGPWELGLTVTNLANRAGVNSRFVDAFAQATDAGGRGVVTQEYVPPRQIVGSVTYRF